MSLSFPAYPSHMSSIIRTIDICLDCKKKLCTSKLLSSLTQLMRNVLKVAYRWVHVCVLLITIGWLHSMEMLSGLSEDIAFIHASVFIHIHAPHWRGKGRDFSILGADVASEPRHGTRTSTWHRNHDGALWPHSWRQLCTEATKSLWDLSHMDN